LFAVHRDARRQTFETHHHLALSRDALLDLCRSLAKGVGISRCKTIIPANRNHVIAPLALSESSLLLLRSKTCR
jgi:hypothetical protein